MTDKTIFLSTGEPSGDAVGAALLSEMRKLGFAGKAVAMGGAALRGQGAEIVVDTSSWGSIGIMQALGIAPAYLRGARQAVRRLGAEPPSLLIPIDFGFFNVRFCRIAKKKGVPVFYFLPPGSWKRKPVTGDLATLCDKIATQFPWSADALRVAGADAEWVGHPVKQLIGEIPPVEGRRAIAILPGSRRHEASLNLPVMAKAMDLVNPDFEVWIACAPSADVDKVSEIWKKHSKMPAKVTNNGASQALKSAVAGIVCSGTATLEAAVCNVPMVVVYAFSPMMQVESYFVMRRPKYIAQPSILLDRFVVPELYGDNAQPERIAEALKSVLPGGEAREGQLQDFNDVRAALGPDNAVIRAAEIAMSFLS